MNLTGYKRRKASSDVHNQANSQSVRFVVPERTSGFDSCCLLTGRIVWIEYYGTGWPAHFDREEKSADKAD